MYIVDASVMVKWAEVDEDDASIARLVKEDFLDGKIDIGFPDHVFFEVMNVLSIKRPDFASAFLSQILVMQMNEFRLNLELGDLALNIAKKLLGVSFYDTVYHALALLLGAVFLTADEKYYKKARKLKNILLLKDYPSR